MISFACKRDSFHFFFEIPKHEAKPPYRSKEDSNRNLNVNVGEVDDTLRKANLPITDSEGRNEPFIMNNPLSGDKTQSNPLRSILFLII